MKLIKYFIQFFFVSFLLISFKILGLKLSRIISGQLFSTLGPLFRSKKIIEKNISFAFPQSDKIFKKTIMNNMWRSYGKILAEYSFIKYFRETDSEKFLEVKGQEILNKIKFQKNL